MRWLLLFVVAFLLCSCIAAQEDEGIKSFLLEAAGNGDIESIDDALDNGENIDTINVNGWTGASFAVNGGKFEALAHLIERGIDLNIANNDGMTPLMLAALQGDKEMVELMLASNADPFIATADGTTAFSVAMESGRKLVALLIAEASVIRGIVSNDLNQIINNIHNGAFVNIIAGSGWTPLIAAAAAGNNGAVNELITLGANANIAENDGWTALHFAAVNGFEDVVDTLLRQRNIDVVHRTLDGRSAKDMALAGGYEKIAKMIDEATPHQDL